MDELDAIKALLIKLRKIFESMDGCNCSIDIAEVLDEIDSVLADIVP